MAFWSAENATKAYLKTVRMAKQPDIAEFISALAAGNNTQLMVVTCANAASPTTLLALVAASQQTGGRIICILGSMQDLVQSKEALDDQNVNKIEFIIGDPQILISTIPFKQADFVLIDCNLENHEGVITEMQKLTTRKSAVLVGYNALCNRTSWHSISGLKTHLLLIGKGLLVAKMTMNNYCNVNSKSRGFTKRHRWITKVDKCTGEEHVFRVRVHHNGIQD